MKRIVAKEFLLLVGCLIVLLLIALFGWIRNAWFEHRADSIGREQVEQSRVLDSLGQLTVPRHLDFLDLFEPEFVRKNCSVFLISPFWTIDPFLTGVPGGPVSRKAKADPSVTRETKPPFDPTKPYTVVNDDPFEEFDGHANYIRVKAPDGSIINFPVSMTEADIAAVMQRHYPNINRRYLMCFAKALHSQGYLTADRTSQLAAVCGFTDQDFAGIERELRAATKQFGTAWKPPIDAEEVYPSLAAGSKSVSWIETLQDRGVPKEELPEQVTRARADTSIARELFIAVRGLLCDTAPYAQLRKGFDYLKEHRALRCDVDDLLYTLQNKAVPPTQEAFVAFAKQKKTVDELRTQKNATRASLWSEAKQWGVIRWAAIMLFVLVWPLRLLVLGTRWAVRTLQAAE